MRKFIESYLGDRYHGGVTCASNVLCVKTSAPREYKITDVYAYNKLKEFDFNMTPRDQEYERFENILLGKNYLSKRQYENCRDFIRMGKQEGLDLGQVCQILASDGYLSSQAVQEILGQLKASAAGEAVPPAVEALPEGQTQVALPGQKGSLVVARPTGLETARASPTASLPQVSIPVISSTMPAFGHASPGQPYLESLLRQARTLGASDLHISVGLPAVLRLHGQLGQMQGPAVTADLSMVWLSEIVSPADLERFRRCKELDFAYAPRPGERYRSNAFFDRLGPAVSFRIISDRVPVLEELGFPVTLKKLTEFRQGLVLVTGPAGSGKSTTLAALLGEINRTRKEHVITIEDPVEFVHTSQLGLVNQRQVGAHTRSFATALRAALRENPDIIMVGEMRDLETISMAITAAETGHLVFGTLHTRGATRTVDRILDVFPPKEQPQIRSMVAESLRAVVSQFLIPNKNGKGRSLAAEILMMNPATANLIRDGRTFQLRSLIQTGKRFGMRLMDDSLLELVESGKVDAREACLRGENPNLFAQYLQA